MKQKNLLIIIILFFILSLAWIGSAIYHSAVKSTISEDLNKNIAPINPRFDTVTINKLREREKIAPVFELGQVISTPIVIPPIKATGEAKLSL